MKVIAKANREIDNGRLWRAKEILQGAVTHRDCSPEIYEKLGNVLLAMQDLREAGRYLFLSGVRKPEYGEAIQYFLSKFDGRPKNLFLSLPKSAKLAKISDYPPAVAEEFRSLGLPEELRDTDGSLKIHPEEEGGDLAFQIGCISAAIILLILLVLGFVKALEIVFK